MTTALFLHINPAIEANKSSQMVGDFHYRILAINVYVP
jgi:hypothetical protein